MTEPFKHYNRVTFVRAGHWRDMQSNRRIAKQGNTWVMHHNGELVLANSLQEINAYLNDQPHQPNLTK